MHAGRNGATISRRFYRKEWHALVLAWLATSLSTFGSAYSPYPASTPIDYFVDSQNGSDANPGTSPEQAWRTLGPVQAHEFQAGDSVNLRRGSSWIGGLVIDDSGAEGNPILFTAYGTGERPVFRNPGGSTSSTKAVTITADWVVLEQLMVQDAQDAGIYVSQGADHNVIRDIEATNVGMGVAIHGQYNLVTKNFVHDLHIVKSTPGGNDDYGAVGIWIFNSHNEVSYNRLVNCMAPSEDYGFDGGAVEWWAGASTIEDSYVHHNWAAGNEGFLEVGSQGGAVINTTVAYNVAVNSAWFGMFNLGGTYATRVEGFRMENNTVIQDRPHAGWGADKMLYLGANVTPGVLQVRNNIFYLDGWDMATHPGFGHDHNLYALHGGGQLGYTLGEGEILADPQWVDYLGEDFHLRSESPAIDAGIALGHSLDLDDRPVPFGLAPDLGAFEHQGEPTFSDVPFSHPYHDVIEVLYQAGYTAGCSTNPLMYCPEATMNRAESSVFVERGIHTATYDPPAPTSQVFGDMPLDSWAAKWVHGLWQDQYTAGCGTNPLMYCPWQGHTRAEGCVFYLRMLHGATFDPPPPTQQTFVDVPLDAWYAKWIQAAYDVGLLPACQTSPDLRFCPNDPLTRALAAYMMVQAKGLLGR